MENQKHHLELADILANEANEYLQADSLCPVQAKAYDDIVNCRTAKIGGHRRVCDKCGHTAQAYNSCRNRHCPKCQYVKKEQWVDKLTANLPPVKHFHLVFTIPHCLNNLFYLNQKAAYDLLFKAAGKTLGQCGKNTGYLGAKTGGIGILHTWGQTLVYHPHVHMIVPAGGFSEDGREWIRSSNRYFLPVRVLSRVFRGILCGMIEKQVGNDNIKLPDGTLTFKDIKEACYKHNWVVYSEKPFKSPENLIGYLGNYTHRVAISNERLIKFENKKVSFGYKDYKCGGIRKTMTLDSHEFIRRFLQHVLPSGFSKIRYFGFLSLRNIKEYVAQCINQINKDAFLPVLEGLTAQEVVRVKTGKDFYSCPECKVGRMVCLPLAEPG
jgi:hypothetical protein